MSDNIDRKKNNETIGSASTAAAKDSNNNINSENVNNINKNTRMLGLFFIFVWVFRIGYRAIEVFTNNYSYVITSNHGVDLIGEIMVPNDNIEAIKIGNNFMKEFNSLISSPNWLSEAFLLRPVNFSMSYNLTVESQKVLGFYENYSIPIVRGKWIVQGHTAKELFNFLISPEGFAVIDPVSTK